MASLEGIPLELFVKIILRLLQLRTPLLGIISPSTEVNAEFDYFFDGLSYRYHWGHPRRLKKAIIPTVQVSRSWREAIFALHESWLLTISCKGRVSEALGAGILEDYTQWLDQSENCDVNIISEHESPWNSSSSTQISGTRCLTDIAYT